MERDGRAGKGLGFFYMPLRTARRRSTRLLAQEKPSGFTEPAEDARKAALQSIEITAYVERLERESRRLHQLV